MRLGTVTSIPSVQIYEKQHEASDSSVAKGAEDLVGRTETLRFAHAVEHGPVPIGLRASSSQVGLGCLSHTHGVETCAANSQ